MADSNFPNLGGRLASGASPQANYVLAWDAATGSWKPQPSGGGPAAVSPPQIHVIYVRTTGNDSTGNGSLAKPYRTLPRAMNDIPLTILSGHYYVVDVTGLGTTILPSGYRLPPFLSTHPSLYDFSAPLGLGRTGPVTIRATYTIRDTLLAPIVTMEPFSNIKSYQEIGKVWVPGQWVGKFVVDALGQRAAIASNNVDTIEVCNGFSALVAPLQIVEPSAEFVGSVYFALAVETSAEVVLQGLKLRSSVASPSSYGLVWNNKSYGTCELCDIEGLSDAALIKATHTGCTFRNKWMLFTGPGSPPSMYYCLLDSINKFFPTYTLGGFWLVSSIAQNGAPLGHGNTGNNRDYSFGLWASIVRNGFSHGVEYVGGSFSFIQNVLIAGNAGHGINAGGPGLLGLSQVGGGGNGGLGLKVANGCQVNVTPNVSVTGAGGDFQVGSLAPLNWVAWRAGPVTNTLDTGAPLSDASRVWQ